MMKSREAVVDYMTPLGLHHLMASRSSLWSRPLGRRRTARGLDVRVLSSRGRDAASASIAAPPAATPSRSTRAPVAAQFGDLKRVPEELPAVVSSRALGPPHAVGSHLWDELVHRYTRGVDTVREMRRTGRNLRRSSIAERHAQVAAFLRIQEQEAKWWRDACIAYFQTFSKRPLPAGYRRPEHSARLLQVARISICARHI